MTRHIRGPTNRAIAQRVDEGNQTAVRGNPGSSDMAAKTVSSEVVGS